MSSTYYVAGPPGTGKSHELSRLCRRAVEQHGADAVAIASLTRAAAAEIGGRDLGLDPSQVGTIHAHAFRQLDRPLLAETPEGIRAWDEAYPHQALGRNGAQAEDALDSRSNGAGVHARITTLRAQMVPRNEWTIEEQAHDAEWSDFKAQTSRLDFTDLVEKCIAEGGPHPARPTVLLIDEVQDCSKLELELIKVWGSMPDMTTVLAGDFDQSIFGFRGADPSALRDLHVTGERRLEQSYRVPRAVHALARAWIRQIDDRVDVSYRPTSEPGIVTASRDTLRRPRALLESLQVQGETRESGDYSKEYSGAPKTTMILATCGYMLAPLIRELRDAGVPFGNPLAEDRGDWNPLRGAGRLKAYLRADERVWGADARCWTWDDLRMWTEPLTARGTLARGAKTLIEAKCRVDEFGETRAHEEVPMEELLELLEDGGMRHPALRGDTAWWESRLRAKERAAATYPLAVLRAGGGRALADEPRVIVGSVHCSPPDEPILTRRGDVPIGELRPDDLLVGWHRNTNEVLGDQALRGGYKFKRSERPYRGPLVVIHTERSRTRVTPNHRVVVRFDEDAFCERWTVYLMRRGPWWRIGTCVTAHRPYRSGGIAGRLATEQAHDGWLLAVYDSRREALIAEAYAQTRYGIPGLTFQSGAARSLSHSDLAAIHSAAAPHVGPRAEQLLTDFGLNAAWPLYTRGPLADGKNRRNMRGNFVTEAANLVALSGCVQMLTTPAIARKATPARATVTTEHYDGPVYGLDVPPHHHYVSGSAIVHNSVKGGEASHVVLCPDLSVAGYRAWRESEAGRDSIRRLMYVGITRARESVTLLAPSSPENVHAPLAETLAGVEVAA